MWQSCFWGESSHSGNQESTQLFVETDHIFLVQNILPSWTPFWGTCIFRLWSCGPWHSLKYWWILTAWKNMQASCPSETVSLAKATRCVTNRKTIRCSENLHFRPTPCLLVHFIYSVLISLPSWSLHYKVQRLIKKMDQQAENNRSGHDFG